MTLSIVCFYKPTLEDYRKAGVTFPCFPFGKMISTEGMVGPCLGLGLESGYLAFPI